MFPSLADLTGHLLPPQVMQGARQLRQSVTQGVLNHLGPLRSLLPPANPRPPDPAMSLVHPKNHLPPLPAQAAPPTQHHTPVHHAPAHHAPAPAKATASCAPAPHAAAPHAAASKPPPAHRHTPRPAPLPSDTTPLITFRDFFGGIGTGFRNLWNFRRGTQQASEDMINPVKIYQGTQQLGGQLATLVPGADGQKAAPGTLARKLGSGFVESINPLDKQNPYDIGYSAANATAVVLPVAGEASALNDLRLGVKAATAEEGAARVAATAAQGTPREAAAAAELARAQARVASAQAALRARLPGAGARKVVAKARVAAQKAKERRAGGAEPPVAPPAPRTPEQVAAAEQKFNAQKQDALDDARHQQLHRRQPALAGARAHPAEVPRVSEAPKSNSTAAIGQPGGKSGAMQMAGQGAEGGAIARKPIVKPTGEAKGKPTGTPEECEKRANAEKKGRIARQNEAADALAYHGYKIEHKPKVLPSDHLNPKKDPDYRIEGQIADCYTPTPGRTADKIRNEISDKVKEGQANHIVLNLTDNPASVQDINRILTGHKEVTGSTYGPLSQVIGVRPKPGAQPVGVEGGVQVYAPQDMDVFQIYP